jgi:translation initiation factor 4E
MKEILELEPSTVIEYKHHMVSMTDLSTFRNAKAYVFAAETAVPATAEVDVPATTTV